MPLNINLLCQLHLVIFMHSFIGCSLKVSVPFECDTVSLSATTGESVTFNVYLIELEKKVPNSVLCLASRALMLLNELDQ